MPAPCSNTPASIDRAFRSPCWAAAAVVAITAIGGCGPVAAPDSSSPRRHNVPEALSLLDSRGEAVAPFAVESNSGTVFLFASIDCPISNRYVPEVRRLVEEFAPRGIAFWLVYPDPQITPSDVRQHLEEFDYPYRALVDPKQQLVRLTEVQVTPEAAVFDSDRKLVYRGRIDNRFVDFGQARREPTTRELHNVLDALIKGASMAFHSTQSVGCPIPKPR